MRKLVILFFLCICSIIAYGQTTLSTITGSVCDSEGQPIAGASVLTMDGKHGTITDDYGNFALNVPEDAILLFSCMGYNDQKLKVVSSRNEYHVSLNEDSAVLRGVVVVGYGFAKKSDLTGSITSVGKESFANQPARHQISVLQAGLQMIPCRQMLSIP